MSDFQDGSRKTASSCRPDAYMAYALSGSWSVTTPCAATLKYRVQKRLVTDIEGRHTDDCSFGTAVFGRCIDDAARRWAAVLATRQPCKSQQLPHERAVRASVTLTRHNRVGVHPTSISNLKGRNISFTFTRIFRSSGGEEESAAFHATRE